MVLFHLFERESVQNLGEKIKIDRGTPGAALVIVMPAYDVIFDPGQLL